MNRRDFCRAALGAASAIALGTGLSAFDKQKPPLGLELSPEQIERGRLFLDKHLSVDLHAHPGLFFVDPDNPSPLEAWFLEQTGGGAFVGPAVAEMKRSGLTLAHFATVADRALLGAEGSRVYDVRPFEPGEAYADHKRQLGLLKEMLAAHDIRTVLDPSDVKQAKDEGKLAAILSTEGADFLEGDIERLPELKDDGFRSVQLVHYRVNELGDIQTDEPRHNGLSVFGREVVRGLNALGIMIDVAHATEKATADAAAVTTHPLVLSHSSLHQEEPRHPRHLTRSHAKLIADTGGIIGAWPAGITSRTFGDFIAEIEQLVEAVGVRHVAIGTDMDGNYRPVFNSYDQLHLIPAALLARGLSEEDTALIMGGNFMRVFASVCGSSNSDR